MSQQQILLHSDINIAKHVGLSQVQKTPKGGKIVYINNPTNGNSRLRIQIPVMTATFGISRFDDSNGASSFSLDLSFKGYETNDKLAGFLNTLKQFDDMIVDAAQKNAQEWFGRDMSTELVREFYKPLVRDSSQGKYAPMIRLKLSPYSEIFDVDQNRVTDFEYITKGSTCRAIVDVSSIWFINKQFGVSLRVLQAAVVSKPATINGFAFQDDDDQGSNKSGEDCSLPAFID